LVRHKDILCIGLKQALLGRLYYVLKQASISVCWATELSSTTGNAVVLADYVEAKGLERDYVYILDADHLANTVGAFTSVAESNQRRSRDRIKLFVALTRSIRE